MSQTRRLAAILAADVVGYSRLMGADEEGTLNRLRAIRAEVVDPSLAQYRGRIVKTTGDGLLVEFGSVVDALRCATDWQRGMADCNADVPPTSRIEFRMGVNVGDVVVKTETSSVLGDFAIDERGFQIGQKAITIQWQDGKQIVVWPDELASGKPRFPTPPWSARVTSN
jgi:class 3 adenylate cyclase